jgi:hypothetical protein
VTAGIKPSTTEESEKVTLINMAIVTGGGKGDRDIVIWITFLLDQIKIITSLKL